MGQIKNKQKLIAYMVTIISGLNYGVYLQLYNYFFTKKYFEEMQIHQVVNTFLSVSHIIGQFIGSVLLFFVAYSQYKKQLLSTTYVLTLLLSILVIQSQLSPLSISIIKLIQGLFIQIQITLSPILINYKFNEIKSKLSMYFQTTVLIGIFGSSITNIIIEKQNLQFIFLFKFHVVISLSLVVTTYLIEYQSHNNHKKIKQKIILNDKIVQKGIQSAIFLSFSQQLTGMAAMDLYQYDYLTIAIQSYQSCMYIILSFQIVDVISMFISQRLLLILKKDHQYVFSLFGIMLFNLWHFIILRLQLEQLKYFIVGRILFLIMLQLGPNGLYYLLCAEYFPENQTEIFYSISQICKRLISVALIITYKILVNHLDLLHLIFACGNLCSIYYFHFHFKNDQYDTLHNDNNTA